MPQLFDDVFAGGVRWPWYLKADAEELYNKWCTNEFETDLYRGKERHNKSKGKINGGTADSLTKKELESHSFRLMDPRQHGNGLLLNGVWWPSQLAALRDGGHGSSQGGITGNPESGAYSVIMAGGLDPRGLPYPNQDDGDEVLYCGTDNKDSTNQPSGNTKALITNWENRQPVRLFRSHNLNSPHAPEIGFRYDGLYDVTSLKRWIRLMRSETVIGLSLFAVLVRIPFVAKDLRRGQRSRKLMNLRRTGGIMDVEVACSHCSMQRSLGTF